MKPVIEADSRRRRRPIVCAGFLLRNSVNNLGARLMGLAGGGDCSSDVELHPDYRAMAIANGVAPDDPVLARCRADDDGPGIRTQKKARPSPPKRKETGC